MSKDYLSIDISDLRINFVVGRQIDDEIYINKMFYVENREGFFDDQKPIKQNELAKVIKKAMKQNKVKTNKAIITVSPVHVEIKDKIIDKVDEDLILDIVKIELLSDEINLDDYEMQILLDEKYGDLEELNHKVKVFLMKKKFVSDVRAVLKASGLVDVHLDITSNGLSKLHKHILKINTLSSEYSLSEREDTTVMYIDLSNENIKVNIMKGYNQELYRSQDNQLFNCLVTGEDIEDEVVDTFIDALELTTRYYKSTKVGNYIDEIFVYGFNDRMERVDYISGLMIDRLMTNVNPLVNIDGILTGNVDENINISCYLNAINALIRL